MDELKKYTTIRVNLDAATFDALVRLAYAMGRTPQRQTTRMLRVALGLPVPREDHPPYPKAPLTRRTRWWQVWRRLTHEIV